MYKDAVDTAPIPFSDRVWKRARSRWEAEIVANALADHVLAIRLSGPAVIQEIEELDYKNVTTIIVERNSERKTKIKNQVTVHKHSANVLVWNGDFHTIAYNYLTSPSAHDAAVWLDGDYTGTYAKMRNEGFVENWTRLICAAAKIPVEYLFVTQTFCRRDNPDNRWNWQTVEFINLLEEHGYSVDYNVQDYGAPSLGFANMSTGFYMCHKT